ncbi:RrF2 family transcriptional regulator [Fodinibius sediminis]|uniref:Transcriptional regulator, BadM/Rrf2 family n=1 Tax=Fodinibius sediminis TaxID=1214077 RepID=A0A521D0X3_9BACT|nr:Rrf2 family transcriptional regulator [Fodinibius sediminis]SMO64661.1 transcriptional regulator, BadM/Rrf2 family [Fodinibius sediminis]
MFSTSCDYGLQAMLFLALHYSDEENIDLTSISKELDIPKHFLSKILQMLVKHKLLISMKGPTGGFRLNRPPSDIRLIEIIDTIDGLDIFNECGIGFKKCNDENPCPIHYEYKEVRNKIRNLFENKTLKELTEDVESGESIVALGHKPSPS